ncbi:MAG: N-acetyl-gamma-glutamyl-phosphate reductase [Syntrophales bacterium]|jgi:N-acetyl-gamma-glutamyl-phosphate reductase|nr:N-acetyl-gamma-glutamyl-phosphate reductase [Syntrophales bacterium]
MKIGIYGASGYTGQELLRLLVRHPDAELIFATSRRFAGQPIFTAYPSLIELTELDFLDAGPEEVAQMVEVVFLALPHGTSMKIAPVFHRAGCIVIDLSADFRLHNLAVYEKWYGKHEAPDLISEAVYGIPELCRDQIRRSRFVANPGCYPTSVILGMAPLLDTDWIDRSSIIVDSKSGTSGAGREPQMGSLFCEVNEGLKAYKVGGQHRHIPEMEQILSQLSGEPVTISFTPHLLPVNRGILSTIYVDLLRSVTVDDLVEKYNEFYGEENFVRIFPKGMFPNLLCIKGTNYCDIGLAVDGRTNRAIIVSAIDNLVKGAAGQAIQNMNLICDLPEEAGLTLVPLFP